MTTPSVRRVLALNVEQCNDWVRNNGTINPATGSRINPNLTTEGSMNVHITNRCNELGITRPGNPYIPGSQRDDSNDIVRNSTSPILTNDGNRRSNVVYRNDNGDIKISRAINFTMSQLNKWWNEGVVENNKNIMLRNPISNHRIYENMPIYNRLLQQADAICLIPIDLNFAPNLSQESIDILTSLRDEIKDDDFEIQDLIDIHPNIEENYMSKSVRHEAYIQYMTRFNKRFRIKCILQNLTETNLAELESIKTKSADDNSPDGEDINPTCLRFASDKTNSKYKKFNNKLMKTCDLYKKQISVMSGRDIFNLISKYYEGNDSIKYRIPNIISMPSIISLFAWYAISKDILNYKFISNECIIVENVEITEDGEFIKQHGIDQGGLRASMMNNVANELLEMKIFIKSANSSKYFFNPTFEFEESHKHILNILSRHDIDLYDTDKSKSYGLFYRFIGSLLSFFLSNNYKIPFHLSTYILNNLKYKSNNITDYEHVLYVSNDLPVVTSSVLNLLKIENPDDIDNIGIEYNDAYKIQKNNDDGDRVTSENLERYIIDFARHINTNNILQVGEKGSDIDANYIYENFNKGIDNNLRKVFQYKKISYDIIDQMLTREDFKEEILTKLSNNISNYITVTNSANELNTRIFSNTAIIIYVEKYTKYMNDILLNQNTGFSQDEHITFLRKLLKFWTGTDYYKPEIHYVINILMYRNGGYPVSHTCSRTIDMPLYETQKEFFDKLKEAVESSFNGFQIAGKKKNKKTVKTVLKYI